MHKTIGSICLVAGTAIGAGMIALPMIMAKLGLLYSIILMSIIWFAMYYSALINVELNLRADNGLSLGKLGKRFSGLGAYILGDTSLIFLCYSLLVAYIHGFASTTTALAGAFGIILDPFTVSIVYSIVIYYLLSLSLHRVDALNRILFLAMLIIIGLFIVALIFRLDFKQLPLTVNKANPDSWYTAIPVLFTSFGFQVIFHTLTIYCEKDAKKLKVVFFWGSLIPALIYTIWIICTLGALYKGNHEFYLKVIDNDQIDVGEFIEVLSKAVELGFMQVLAWVISLLAIITSTIGVSLGLIDIIKGHYSIPSTTSNNTNNDASNNKKEVKLALSNLIKITSGSFLHRQGSIALTMLGAGLIAAFIPNAFIQGLSFAGMVLAFLAILLPIYLHWKSCNMGYFYKLTQYKILHLIVSFIALTVIICEFRRLGIINFL